jgi:hypothetical protein
MSARQVTSRGQAIIVCAIVVATGLICAALVSAAALVPAPPAVLPLISAVCVGCPFAAGGELRHSIRVLRDPRLRPLRRRHLVRLRHDLDRLPETDHPLGL